MVLWNDVVSGLTRATASLLIVLPLVGEQHAALCLYARIVLVARVLCLVRVHRRTVLLGMAGVFAIWAVRSDRLHFLAACGLFRWRAHSVQIRPGRRVGWQRCLVVKGDVKVTGDVLALELYIHRPGTEVGLSLNL